MQNRKEMEDVTIMELKNNFSTEGKQYYFDLGFNDIKISEIEKGFLDGLSEEQIQVYANPDLHWK